MTHNMRLVDFAFKRIKNKEKDIELRLNDEKRRLINIGNNIIFTHLDTNEKIKVEVTNLYKYKTFKELFDNLDNSRFGLDKNDTFEIMYNFYTKEEEEKYGALGIEIKLLSEDE